MKKKIYSIACATALSTVMVLQSLCPTVAFAIDTIEDSETETVETVDTSGEDFSVDVTEPTETLETEYEEIVEEVPETEVTEPSSEEEEIISSATNTDPTEETEETTEATEETTVESIEETMVETVEEPVEYVEFDHYYSDIDESLIQTPELFVQSSSNVFTSNTTVVSNYEDVYIISFDSIETARYAYSYYVDKVENITDLSDIVFTADNEDVADMSNINEGDDAISNLNDIEVTEDYTGYIALIDTGAEANIKYSVIGNDTSDNNGHGTNMLDCIRAENPYARIISIKVSEDGSATAADIYAGFKLAMELEVSTINFSMTGLDIEKNAIIKDVIQEAVDSNIIVIGSAGNGSTTAHSYIPGCIDGVITVGAVDNEGNKISSSNYDADAYAIANSTSEAAAKYTGLYTANMLVPGVTMFESVKEDADYMADVQWAYDLADELTDELQENRSDSSIVATIDEDCNVSFSYVEGDFTIAAVSHNPSEATQSITTTQTIAANTYTGRCSYVMTSQGGGYAYGFDGTLGTFLNAIGKNSASNPVSVICSSYFSNSVFPGASSSSWARSLQSCNAYYRATVVKNTSGGVNINIEVSDRSDVSQVTWTPATITVSYNVTRNGTGQSASYTVDFTNVYDSGSGTSYNWSSFTVDGTNVSSEAIRNRIQSIISSQISGQFSGKKDWNVPGFGGGVGEHTGVINYYTGGAQVMAGRLLTSTSTPPVKGSVTFNKIDEDGIDLSGAVIQFQCIAGTGTTTFKLDVEPLSGITNWHWNSSANCWEFTTTGDTIVISELSPNTTYKFHEIQAPVDEDGEMYQFAPDIQVITNAQGNTTQASYSMIDNKPNKPTTDGMYGSLQITKTWDTSVSYDAQFWSDVSKIDFGIYGALTYEDAYMFTNNIGDRRGLGGFAYGKLESPENDGSQTVFWSVNMSGPMRDMDPSYIHFWGNNGHGTVGWLRWNEWGPGAKVQSDGSRDGGLASYFIGLPRERYYVIREQWTDGVMASDSVNIIINTENNSGWHEWSTTPGYHMYEGLYYIDANGITYFCDYETLQPLYALTLTKDDVIWHNDHFTDTVDNEEATGSLDLIKVDETGNGVDGLTFEVHVARAGNPLVATGKIDSFIGQNEDGYNAYSVVWDYAVVRKGTFQYWQNVNGWADVYHQDGSYNWGDSGRVGGWATSPSVYNINEISSVDMNWGYAPFGSNPYGVPTKRNYTPDEIMQLYNMYLEHPENYTTAIHASDYDAYGRHGLNCWREGIDPVPVYFGPNFNPETGNLNEIQYNDADTVINLSYGDYYIYEYCDDITKYDIPDGWKAYDEDTQSDWEPGDAGTPEYFYKRVTISNLNHITPLMVEVANKPNSTTLSVNKTTPASANFTQNNPNYSLANTTFEVYSTPSELGDHLGTIIIEADGSSNTIEIDNQYANGNVFMRETIAGNGYKIKGDWITVSIGAVGSDNTATVENVPAYDNLMLELQKVSDVSDNFNGTISAENAQYTVNYYYSDDCSGNVAKTWVYKTDTDGKIDFSDSNYIVSGTPYSIGGIVVWPIGSYTITETKVPNDGTNNTGLELSTITYQVVVSYDSVQGVITTVTDSEGNTLGNYIDDATRQPIVQVETEIWEPIGLIKVDTERVAHGQDGNEAQGNGSLAGAEYQVYTSNRNIFNGTSTYEYNGKTYSVSDQAVSGMYLISVDDEPLTIVIGDDGYGETEVELPWADCYYAKESVAPKGYVIDNTAYPISKVWTDNTNNNVPVIIPGTTHAVATVDVTGYEDGRLPEQILRGSLEIQKLDATTNTNVAQGDASLAGIKYAIVNTSNYSIFYTPTGTEYAPGEVVAILTTDNDGYCATPDNALPYGTYDVYELRVDSTLAVGDTFSEDKLGTSIYANDSYLHATTWGTSTEITSEQAIVEVETITVVNDGDELDLTYTDDVVRGSIEIHKLNTETEDQINQGANTFAGIKFAVVNRSAKAIVFEGTSYNPGEVIAILEASADGDCDINDLPYGTYDVYELRMDATIEAGDVYNGSTKLGTSDKANDYYLFDDTIGTPYTISNNPETAVIRAQAERFAFTWNDTPVRGDISFEKYFEDGNPMGYIPFLISLLDDNGTVVEQHVVLVDSDGKINTNTRNRDITTLNSLDQYYSGGKYTGPLTDEAAAVNIWFGDIEEYPNANNVVRDDRGCLLYGTYRIEELMCENNKGQDMLEDVVKVETDNTIVGPDHLFVDLTIHMTSQALDLTSDSTTLTLNDAAPMQDTVLITNLKVKNGDGTDREYKLVTNVYEVLEDGTVTLVDTAETEFTVPATSSSNTSFIELKPQFTIDTSNVTEGSYVYFEDLLYQKINGSWTEDPIQVHNTDDNFEVQRLYAPKITTTATNLTTESRIAALNENTLATDYIEFSHLPDKMLCSVEIALVDSEGNVVKNINDDDCSWTKFFYLRENATGLTTVTNGNTTMITAPTTCSFTTNDLGIDPFEVDFTKYDDVHFVITVRDALTDDIFMQHNEDGSDYLEAIGRVKIGTTAVDDEDGDHSVVCGEVTITDTIEYTNVLESVEVRVDGQVIRKSTGEVIAENSITTTLNETGFDGKDYIEMPFGPFDTSDYSNEDLVVFEKVYMIVNGEDVLISEHTDLDDNDQTITVAGIKTEAKDKADGDNIIDGTTAEPQTIVDTVTYTNLTPGKTYTMTGVLVVKNDDETAPIEYVLDDEGNPITSSTEFIADDSGNGTVEVEFTFVAQNYTAKKIVVFEECYEENNPIPVAVHADINDEAQTVFVSVILKVSIAKADAANISYMLKDAEITIFNADGTIAKDINGNDCVGLTDANGEITFEVLFDDPDNVFYAQETKAPAGYDINPDKFELQIAGNKDEAGKELIKIQVLDNIILIPPKTGDSMNLGLYITLIILASIGVTFGTLVLNKKKKKDF